MRFPSSPRAAITLALVIPAASLGVASLAQAHLALTTPSSRYGGGGSEIKQPPCGVAGGTRTDNVYTYEPGATISIEWNEYINHPGHFRIAFDDDGDDDFTIPPCLSDCESRGMVIGVAPGDYTDPTVLADGIASTIEGGITRYEVTLPDIECDNCTLQVIQVMTDKPPYGPSDPDDLYYECVDLVLRRGADADGGVIVMDGGLDAGSEDGGSPADSGGPGTGDSSTGSDTGAAADGGGTGSDDGGCSVSRVGTGTLPLASLFGLAALGLFAGRRRNRRSPH